MSSHGWIGVDLDGTLAHYDGWKGVEHVGAPVPAMVERVKRWLEEGREVRIFTARVGNYTVGSGERDEIEAPIRAFCLEQFGRELEITNVKDFGMIELWDDRAVQVEENTGKLLGKSRAGLDDPATSAVERPAREGGAEFLCPRRAESFRHLTDSDVWRPDDTCSYCGSLDPDVLMKRLDAGDVELGPTDKSYKVYVENKGGEPLKAHGKFYFQHLSEAQMRRFVDLYNEKRLQIGFPGHFYRYPFFMQRASAPAAE